MKIDFTDIKEYDGMFFQTAIIQVRRKSGMVRPLGFSLRFGSLKEASSDVIEEDTLKSLLLSSLECLKEGE